MKFFNKQKNITKQSLHHKSGPGEQVERDWEILVVVFAAVLILVVLVDGYIFMQINRGELFSVGVTPTQNRDVVNRKTLLDTASFFEARQKEYADFRAANLPQIDPSI